MAKTRTITSDAECPRCGKPILHDEVGTMVAERSEPVRWDVVRKRCSGGCLLTVDDFPAGD